jgi:hypothetical protein
VWRGVMGVAVGGGGEGVLLDRGVVGRGGEDMMGEGGVMEVGEEGEWVVVECGVVVEVGVGGVEREREGVGGEGRGCSENAR